jgi:hypothetical protein
MCSIVNDNIELCSKIDDKQIEMIIKIISEKGHQSR